MGINRTLDTPLIKSIVVLNIIDVIIYTNLYFLYAAAAAAAVALNAAT